MSEEIEATPSSIFRELSEAELDQVSGGKVDKITYGPGDFTKFGPGAFVDKFPRQGAIVETPSGNEN
jgi:bacteriocin-like protein